MSDSRGELLEKNVKIIGENNTPVTIKSLISDKGGQGDVYLVNYRGNDYAMKCIVSILMMLLVELNILQYQKYMEKRISRAIGSYGHFLWLQKKILQKENVSVI